MAIDERAPGLVEGLYLHGSLALTGEFFPGSDIDFVAVLPARPGDAELGALAAFGPRWHPIIHEALRARERPQEPSGYGDGSARGQDCTEFTAMALQAGLALTRARLSQCRLPSLRSRPPCPAPFTRWRLRPGPGAGDAAGGRPGDGECSFMMWVS